MQDQLKEVFNPEKFREQGHQIVDLLANYLMQCKNGEPMAIIPKEGPLEVLAFWNKNLKEPNNDLVKYLQDIIARSTKVHHPKYIGHQVSAPSPIASLMDFFGSFLNNGMAVFEMGATSSAMEKIIMDWLSKKIGWINGGGLITSGGSLANLTAILAARENKVLNAWNEGNSKENLALMVSEEAHYCVERAVKILGWGSDGVIKVPTDSKFKLRPELLEELYEKATRNGKKIIAVVGSACSTSTGSYDPLVPIGQFCQKHNLWFHIDGAHGGPIVFSEKLKHRIKGIELADSVVMDFHKMMLTPALSTALIFKDDTCSYNTFSQKAAYLLDDDEKRWFDTGLKTVECTKRMVSTKIFTLLKFEGEQVFEAFINQTHDLASHFATKIEASDDFELAVKPESNIVCFRYYHKEKNNKLLNILNEKARKEIVASGSFYIVKTTLRGIVYLRITIMSPYTNKTHLDQLLQEIRTLI